MILAAAALVAWASVAALAETASQGEDRTEETGVPMPWLGPVPPLALPALAPLGTVPLVAPEPNHLPEGRTVVVHFFATWCEPCREEMASLRTLAGTTDIAVVGIDVGEVPVTVARFLAEAPVPFPVLMDQDMAAADAWGVRAVPTTFVLDDRLAPRLKVIGTLDWQRPDVVASLIAVGRPTDAGEAAQAGTSTTENPETIE